jgi:hypothetical protein
MPLAGHRHSHSHATADAPPQPRGVTTASILRLSAGQRLLVAAGLSCVLWALVYWAMA